MLNVTNLVGFGAGNIPPTVEYIATHPQTANAASYTQAGASLGTEGGNRAIIIAATTDGGAIDIVVSSVTVGGVSASLIVQTYANSGGLSFCNSIWIARVPTGTTGDIVVNGSGTMNRGAISVYAARNLNTLTSPSTANGTALSTTPTALTLTAPDGGFAVGCCSHNIDTTTFTWAVLTEDADAAVEASTRYGAASANFTSGGTKSVTVAAGVSDAGSSAVAAYFA